ncbi:MAG: TIGR02556 family CRISPR-associated protein [Candidatus Heimdallarchaeota archaeon]|nr:TIGR02556 family CRISPR-associated protein [Candidatus Heimdallarchaeota archaeon]MCK4610192.1 TIGR02556 family CRISPR-associated protein [Candidatus Heimdallarchaeota archaeon]
MLKAVMNLGKYQYEDEIESFIKHQALNKVIFIDFEYSNGEYQYLGIHDEDYDKNNESKYLYKIDAGNQYTFSLTDKISTIEKSIYRLSYWFKKFKRYDKNSFVGSLEQAFEDNKEKIIEDIHKIYDVYDKSNRRNCLLSFKIIEDEESKYLGNYEIFRTIFREVCINEFWAPKTPKVNGICYLCNNEKEIARPREPFNFYSINKLGFVYSLDESQAWKQLAICSKCALELSAGKRFLEQYLSKNMYGIRFFLIPTPIQQNDKIMNRMIENIKFYESEKSYQHCLVCESDSLEILKDFGISITLSFVFYQASQGMNISITRYVEDVTPSWINSLFDHFEKTTKKSIFSQESLQSIFGNKWSGEFLKGKLAKSKYPFLNNLGGLVRKFFPNSKKETGVHDHYFIDFIASILEKKHINEKILLRAFMRELRNKFRRNDNFYVKMYALGSLYLLLFLTEIELFGFDEKMISEKNIIIENERTKEIEDFFKEFENTFNSSSKRAIFSEGVLTSFLLDLQRMKRDSEPFRSKLNGLKLDERRVKNLFPLIIEKLQEYKAGYYFWLEELISKYFIQSETEGWNLTKNEISYYFTLGLSVGRIFKKKKGEKENDTE